MKKLIAKIKEPAYAHDMLLITGAIGICLSAYFLLKIYHFNDLGFLGIIFSLVVLLLLLWKKIWFGKFLCKGFLAFLAVIVPIYYFFNPMILSAKQKSGDFYFSAFYELFLYFIIFEAYIFLMIFLLDKSSPLFEE